MGHGTSAVVLRLIATVTAMKLQPDRAAPETIVGRKEDRRFVTGQGRYADDIVVPGLCHAAIVRSTVAHADIVEIDTAIAAVSPGVLAVLTGKDFAEDKLGDIPCESIPAAVVGKNWFRTPFQALIADRVLAVCGCAWHVVAESRIAARRAAALVSVSYRNRDAVISIEDALAEDAPDISRREQQYLL